jgi:RNA polymerase sigma-70 factor (ECF subfamily)
LRERELAEEATIDVFTQVWMTAGRYDASRGSVLGWILNFARTRSIDLLRARARRAEREEPTGLPVSLSDPGPSPERALGEVERARRLRRALLKLPIEQRRAIETAYFRGLSHSEVAVELGQPLGTVKTRIRDGLTALRRSLASELGELA